MRYFYLTVLSLSISSRQANSNVKTNLHQTLYRHAFRKSNQDPMGLTKQVPDKMYEDANNGNWDQEVKSQDMVKDTGRDLASSEMMRTFYKRKDNNNINLNSVLNNQKRRRYVGRTKKDAVDKESKSSDLDLPYWKDEWKEIWVEKKFDALNSTMPRGDVFNMLAARPWGRSCGDPNQHDMQWGSCMMPQDCEAEFRIYRGDQYCGRSMYICCALIAEKYDMYGGIDLSFAGSSFETDSKEVAAIEKVGASKETERKERRDEKNKRKIDRNHRKKKIIKTIKQIVRKMKKVLNTAFRNGTFEKKSRTKELKHFIANLKKKFKKDRMAIVDVHHHDLAQIDENLKGKLNQIKVVNNNLMTNDTFRQLIVNGSLNKPLFMAILRSNPDMLSYIENEMSRDGIDLNLELKQKTPDLKKQATNDTQIISVNKTQILSVNNTRRSVSILDAELDKVELNSGSHTSGYVDHDSEYDVEYGLLYY